jgi:hypothetical protein
MQSVTIRQSHVVMLPRQPTFVVPQPVITLLRMKPGPNGISLYLYRVIWSEGIYHSVRFYLAATMVHGW